MLDTPLRRLTATAIAPVAADLARAGTSANLLTIVGFVVGLGALAAVATHNYWWGLGLIAVNRFAAALDGPLARLTTATDLGAFLETVFGFIVAAGVAFGFALADPSRALASGFLIFAFGVSGVAYLAFAAIDARRGTANRGPELIRYPAGLIENTEAFLALALACAVPGWFSVIAYVLGALCFATAGMRIAEAVLRFKEP